MMVISHISTGPNGVISQKILILRIICVLINWSVMAPQANVAQGLPFFGFLKYL